MSGKSDIGPFAIVPRWVMHACKGKPQALGLYAVLADHADREADNGWTIGRQELADEMCVVTKTIDRAVKHLEAIGALEVTRQRRGPENIWSRYTIHMAEPGGWGHQSPQVAAPESPGGDSGVALPIEPPTRTPSMELGDAFTDFWAGYPRKIGKPAASRAWKKVKGEEYLAVMLGLSLWVKFWKDSKTEDQFIPHASRWLNERRWEDQVTSPVTDVVDGGIIDLPNGYKRNTANGSLWVPPQSEMGSGYWQQDIEWFNKNRRRN